jgi:hypothetical protein
MSDIEEPEPAMPMFGSFQAGAAGLNLQIQYNSGGFLAGSANFTFDGTTATVNALTVTNAVTLNAGTANQVQYLNGSKVLTGSANLTFDGTTLTAAGFAGPFNGTVGAGTANTGSFTTLLVSSTFTLSTGTANGVPYLNGSKIVTTGTALAFDGTNLTLGTGNIVQGTAAKGYNFTANTALAGKTSQLLNWYEEGTWTPTVTSQAGAITTYASGGTYTRVGRQVTVTAYVDLTNVGTASGYLQISNFPFKNGGASGAGYLQQTGTVRETGVTGVIYVVLLAGNSTTGYINSLTGGAIVWTNTYQYALTITYYTA